MMMLRRMRELWIKYTDLRYHLRKRDRIVVAVMSICLLFMGLMMWHSWLHRHIGVPLDVVKQQHYDGVLVLGYSLETDGQPTAVLKQRLDAVVELLEAGSSEHVICSGGYGYIDAPSEAFAMARYLKSATKPTVEIEFEDEYSCEFNLNEEPKDMYASVLLDTVKNKEKWVNIFLENASKSTRENIVFSMPLMLKYKWNRIVLLTSPFHQWRSERVFRQYIDDLNKSNDIEIIVAALPRQSINVFIDTFNILREVAAIVYYYLNGWI